MSSQCRIKLKVCILNAGELSKAKAKNKTKTKTQTNKQIDINVPNVLFCCILLLKYDKT